MLVARRDAEIAARPQVADPHGARRIDRVEVRSVAGVATYVAVPDDHDAIVEVPDDALNLHLHGGALVFGGGEACRGTASAAAADIGITTWCVDYGMPPGHPFPRAVEDALAVYRAVLETRDPSAVVVSGLSAGGNIAAAALVRARDAGLPLPAALVLQTPEVDLSESGDTFTTLAGVDTVLSSLLPVNRLYAAGRELTDPVVSPLFADLTGLPPTLLQSGTRDLFLSNTVRMHRALLAAGVPAELHVFDGMPHAGFGGGAPEDREVAQLVREFVARHLRRAA